MFNSEKARSSNSSLISLTPILSAKGAKISNVSFAINIHEKNYKKLDYYILKKLKTKCEQARSYFSIISNFNNSNNIKVMFNNLNNFNIFPDLLIINNKNTLENKKDIIDYVDRLQFPPLKIFFLSSKKVFLSNL